MTKKDIREFKQFVRAIKEKSGALPYPGATIRALLDLLLEWNVQGPKRPEKEACEKIAQMRGISPRSVHRTFHDLDHWVGKFTHKGIAFKRVPERTEFRRVEVAADVTSSWDALIRVCQERNELILRELELSGRYRPDLYVAREQAEQEFQSFLKSQKSLFIVTGKSGLGKTNLVCEFVRKCEYPALLFLGEQYQETAFGFPEEVDATVARIYGDVGSDTRPSVNLCDIGKMASDRGSLFLVLIDALNEFRRPASVLETLTRWVMEQGRTVASVRICLTCREETWRHLTREKQPFLPPSLIYPSSPETAIVEWDLPYSQPRLQMSGFSKEELVDAVKSYRKAYRVKGRLSPQARDICHDPFMLRLVFHSFEGRELPPDILETTVFDAFWSKTVGTGSAVKEEFIKGLTDYLCSECSTQIDEGRLRRLPWYRPRALRELLDLNVLTRMFERYASKIGFFHDRFFEYALARRLYQNREDLFENPASYMKTAGSYEPMEAAIEQFLGMLETNKRRDFCRRLAATGEEGVRIVCQGIGKLPHIDDQDFQIVKSLLREEPGGRLSMCLGPIVWCRPAECLDLVKEALPRVLPATLEHPSSFSLFVPGILNQILERFPAAVDTIRDWFCHDDDRIRFIATFPYLRHLSRLGNEEEALKVILESAKDDCALVRHEAARLVGVAFDFDPDQGFSLWTDLADDPDENVRNSAIYSALERIRRNPDMFSRFEAWQHARKPRLRRSVAALSGWLLSSTSGEVWDTVLRLSDDEEDSVRLELYAKLGETILRPGDLLTAYHIPEVLALLGQGLRHSSREFREQLASKHRIYRAEPILHACERWITHEAESLRHFAALVTAKSWEGCDPSVWARLARDPCADVRSAVPLGLVSQDQETLDERFTILLRLTKDEVPRVRRAAICSSLAFHSGRPEEIVKLLNDFASSRPCWTDTLTVAWAISDFLDLVGKENPMWGQLISSLNPTVERLLVPFATIVLPKAEQPANSMGVIRTMFESDSWWTQALLTKLFCLSLLYGGHTWQGEDSLNCLRIACSSSSSTVRRELAEGLCYLIAQKQELVTDLWPFIEILREDQDWWVQVILAICVSLSIEEGAAPTLLQALPRQATDLLRLLSESERDWAVRGAACLSAASLPPKEKASFFERMAQDEHRFVKKWAKRLRKRTPDANDSCKLYAEIFCRDLPRFQQELAYDLPVNYHKSLGEASALVAPMLKFNRSGTMKVLEEWAACDDDTLREVAQRVLRDASNGRLVGR